MPMPSLVGREDKRGCWESDAAGLAETGDVEVDGKRGAEDEERLDPSLGDVADKIVLDGVREPDKVFDSDVVEL